MLIQNLPNLLSCMHYSIHRQENQIMKDKKSLFLKFPFRLFRTTALTAKREKKTKEQNPF